MNQVLLTLQMMDDWTDWKQDLADGSYNCLLSLIKSELGRPHGEILTLPEVQEAIYINNMMKPYADIAAATHTHLLSIDIDAPISSPFIKRWWMSFKPKRIISKTAKKRFLMAG